MSISPLENYKRALRHEKIEYVPLRSDTINFCPRIMPENIVRGWVEEKNKYTGPKGGKDMFGVDWVFVPEVGGSMVRPGHPFMEDISEWKEKCVWPDIDSWDWEGSAKENNEWLESSGKFVETWIFTGYFERLIALLEFENAAMTLIDEDAEDDLNEFFTALTDLYCKIIKKLHETFPAINCIYLHDDWGSQMAPFFSMDACREKIAPHMKRVVDCCHENDMFFDFHSCGKCERLAPVMIECGMDAWCGQELNNKVELAKKYGDKIMIGKYDKYTYGELKVPESDEELYAQVEAYLEPFKEMDRSHCFMVADMTRNPRVVKAFRDITTEWYKD